jgi:hypothetical protein
MSRARRLGAAAAVAAAVAGAAGGAGAGSREERAGGAAVARGGAGRTLLSGAVRYALPEGWVVQADLVACGSEGVAVVIPCPPLDATPHSANANLLAVPNDGAEGLAAWSARRLAVAAPTRIVDDRVEETWRTIVSAGEDRGVRYVVVERFGATPAARVHAVAAFPALPAMGARWFVRTGEEIDRFLGSLAIAGAPPSGVRVGWRGGTLRLDGGRRAGGPPSRSGGRRPASM